MFDVELAGERVRSELEGFTSDPTGLSDEAIESGFGELQAIVRMAEAKRLMWLRELERRGLHRTDGYLSTAAWLTDRYGVAAAAAKRQVKAAAALGEMPEVRGALVSGELSPEAVPILASAKEAHPEAFASQESALVGEATSRGTDELRAVVTEWSAARDAEAPGDRAERMRERRRLDLCPGADGMAHLAGALDPEGGGSVLTAFGAIVDAELRATGGTDGRTPSQRRADALVVLAERFLSSMDRPTVGGERPNLTVSIDAVDLLAGTATGTLDHGGAVPSTVARRLGCDASVTRVLLGPRSEPLDVGRKTPVIPPALRRAVVVRDRRCRFPGCTRPHGWCDAHHAVHWADGGETKLSNLVLLCRPHHRSVHEGGFGLHMADGVPVFRRPDGSVLEDGRAPP